MRRISALLLASLLALTLAAPAFAATTIPVRAFVKENFERAPSNRPCEFDEATEAVTCFGFGNAKRFGPLTSVIVFSSTGETTRTLTLRDGSTVILEETYDNFQTPGKSGEAPGIFHSFGNPGVLTGTFVVIGGTGALEGASGSGTIKHIVAGNTRQIFFTGTITLP